MLRRATYSDKPAIEALVAAFWVRLGYDAAPSRSWERADWVVAERGGRITAAIATRDVPEERLRHIVDLVRDESSGRMTLADMSALALTLIDAADLEGWTLTAQVARRNGIFGELLHDLGDWEPISVMYRRRANRV